MCMHTCTVRVCVLARVESVRKCSSAIAAGKSSHNLLITVYIYIGPLPFQNSVSATGHLCYGTSCVSNTSTCIFIAGYPI